MSKLSIDIQVAEILSILPSKSKIKYAQLL